MAFREFSALKCVFVVVGAERTQYVVVAAVMLQRVHAAAMVSVQWLLLGVAVFGEVKLPYPWHWDM